MCSNAQVVEETMSLVSALGLKGGSTFKLASWSSVLSILAEGPHSCSGRSVHNEPFDLNAMMRDTFNVEVALRVVDVLYIWSNTEGVIYKIVVPPPQKAYDFDSVAAMLSARARVLHELWDKNSRVERLVVMLSASRVCFDST